MQEKLKGPEGESKEEAEEREKKEKFDNLKERKQKLLKKDWDINNGKILEHRQELMGKLKGFRGYALYYVLGSSDYGENKCEHFDFTDDKYSVEKLIERLEKEQEAREKEQEPGNKK